MVIGQWREQSGGGDRHAWGGLGWAIWKVKKPSDRGAEASEKEGSWGRGIQAEGTASAQARVGVCLSISRNIQESRVCVGGRSKELQMRPWCGHYIIGPKEFGVYPEELGIEKA